MFVLITRHNSIIRECLHVHAGREVKHTGDGMMASFGSVTHAVDCAIAIQQAFDVHNANDPDGAMRVRIGLSAGERQVADERGGFAFVVTMLDDFVEQLGVVVGECVRTEFI